MARLVYLAALCVAAAGGMAAQPRPVLLTTDCGADMDDQWALAHLITAPEFDVRAVVTTHTGKNADLAPPAAETSSKNARDVIAHIPGGKRPEVMPGSSVPLNSRTPLPNKGVERILSESRAFSRDRRLTVLVIGAATDTASALLTDKTLADRIEIIAMGFKSWAEGGTEYNIQNDPLAWQVILDSGVPVTLAMRPSPSAIWRSPRSKPTPFSIPPAIPAVTWRASSTSSSRRSPMWLRALPAIRNCGRCGTR